MDKLTLTVMCAQLENPLVAIIIANRDTKFYHEGCLNLDAWTRHVIGIRFEVREASSWGCCDYCGKRFM